MNSKITQRKRRHARIRAKVFGTADRPRLSIHRSNKGIRAQIINDDTLKTMVFVLGHSLKGKTKTDRAVAAGKTIADAALKKGITKVVFDRGGFLYTGQIRAFADSARAAGLLF